MNQTEEICVLYVQPGKYPEEIKISILLAMPFQGHLLIF